MDIYVVMGQSQFIVVLSFKLFSFQSYIIICCNCTVLDLCANCTIKVVLTHSLEIHCLPGPTTAKCVALCVMDSMECQEMLILYILF